MNLARGLLLCCSLLSGACATQAAAGEFDRSVTLAAGPPRMGSQGWSGYGERVLVSLQAQGRGPGWPCGIEAAVQYANAESKDDSFDSSVEFFAVQFGATEEWRPFSWLRLVAGAGPRLGLASMTYPGMFNQVSENDGSLGVYAHAGLFVRILGGLCLGLDGQWADGSDYRLNDESRAAQVSVLLLSLRWEY